MNNKNLLIWDYSLDGLVYDNKVDGISVQLYFWSKIFVENGWGVFSLTRKIRTDRDGFSFIKLRKSKLDFFFEWIKVVRVIRKTHSRLIIVRGADRKTFSVAMVSKWLKVKFVFFAASDVNFMPGKEQINGVKINRKLYQKSIHLIPYVVVQNNHQKQTLFDNYGKTSLTISNIWKSENNVISSNKSIDVIWIANFKRLKRAEWMVETARINPHLRFALIGGPSADKEYYQQIECDCSQLGNVTFYGPLGFNETNDLVAQSRILACTSEFEGFPNTFLQAWAYSIPVVSTVDPSHIIVQNNLGIIVENKEGFNNAILHLLNDTIDFNNKCDSIKKYFLSNHSADTNYARLMAYIQE